MRRWSPRRGSGRARACAAVALTNAVTVILFVVATKLTTAANAIFLQETAPLWVLLLAPLLLGERPSRGELVSIPVYAAGLALFFVDDLTAGQITGKLCALGSGLAFGVTIVGLRHLREEGPGALLLGERRSPRSSRSRFWGTGPAATPADLGAARSSSASSSSPSPTSASPAGSPA